MHKYIALVTTAGLISVTVLWSATTQSGMNKMQGCKDMMQQRQKLMSEMSAQNEQLQNLVSQLNQASQQEKTDLLAQSLPGW